MRKTRILKSVLAVSAAAMISVTAVGSYNDSYATREEYVSQLTEIEKEQSAVNSKISDADSELKRERNKLDSINKDYAVVREHIRVAEDEINKLEKQIADTDAKMTELQSNIEKKTKQIKSETSDFMQRIRAMYIAGGSDTYMSVLTDSSDFYDVLMRLELMKRVADHDNEQLDKLVEQKKDLEKLEKDYKAQQDELNETCLKFTDKLNNLNEQKSKLAQMESQQGKTINQLESQKQTLVQRSNELEQKHSEISSKADTTTTTTTTTTTRAA
ncbi:MAG: hypothetical protein IJM32_08575, partial [Ruminococcus sp.]|nr:hypothetical protein [Ruminococcus sp.]